jgi:hypothetical protein
MQVTEQILNVNASVSTGSWKNCQSTMDAQSKASAVTFQRPIFRAPLRTVFIADANMPGDFFFRLLVAVFFADFFALRAILNLPLFPKFSSGTIR